MGEPGVIYTRGWVVDFVLDLAGYTSDHALWVGTVVEPSCGDGAFLSAIVHRLCASLKAHGLEAIPSTLAACVCAYDIDPAKVETSRSVVRDVLRGEGVGERDADELARVWVSEGDFLLANVPEARWVVGNPPYVRASLLPRDLRSRYAGRLSCVTMGTDLYVGFYQKGLEALGPGGALCYVCSDRWLQNRYGTRLREYVSASFSVDALVRMHETDAFEEEVAAYPAITLIRPDTGRPLRYLLCHQGFREDDVQPAEAWLRGGTTPFASRRCSGAVLPPLEGGGAVALASPALLRTLGDVSRRLPTLEDAGVRLGIGVATGCDAVYVTEDADLVERDRLLPLFFMRDWRAGRHNQTKYLVNPWRSDGTLASLDDYPLLKAYFHKNESRLRARRVARDHPAEWYRTLDRPNLSLMGKEMLLFPDMAATADPVLSDGSRYPHHNCYWMMSEEWDARSLGGLMMSDVVAGFVDAYGVKMRGSTLRFQAQYLRMVHVPRAQDVDEETCHELAAAFETGDRARANAAAHRAYGLEAANA